MEDFIGRRRQGKEVILAKSEMFQIESPSFGKRWWSIRQITSLVLTRYFQIDWLKITLPGEAEIAIWLCIKSWFTDGGLAQVTPF